MYVTTADLWEVEPGVLHTWRVHPTDPDAATPVQLSANQLDHLQTAWNAVEPSVWLAAVFQLEGPVDVDALERAFQAFVARHGTLQCEASPGDDGPPTAVRHAVEGLVWERTAEPAPESAEITRKQLREALDLTCAPFGYPAFLPAVVVREDSATVVFGTDHLHTDAWSVTIAVEELHALYTAEVTGVPVVLPATADFTDRSARWAAAPALDPDDERLARWQSFLAARDHQLPVFPLPLGVEPGARTAQSTDVRNLLDADQADALDKHARAQGASAYAAALSALGEAVRELGGAEDLALTVPVHTRTDEADRRAVGWFTTSVPLMVTAGAKPGDVAVALRQARELAEVPLDRVIPSLTRPLVRTRVDVFMVSWLDYRKMPAATVPPGLSAAHVSAPTLADDVQIWLSRTARGLDVRVRHPDTAQAHETVPTLLAAWRRHLVHEDA